ncbi:hypothetical protein [Nocardia brasiliensis]|uniref:hypothetical protein n=1 Tax=Nocardia brasiliensis TaxID=37326 RepID=UPI002458615F|nr:hypothetical protein [Nocardia brasiliensis]
MLTAWGDESGSQPARDPGTYILAAALIEDDDIPLVRKTMDGLLLPGETKVHWHGSSEERRHALVCTVASLPVCGLVVVHCDLSANDRRHRRKCLEHLFPHLEYLACGSVTLESRGAKDGSDLDILQKFRARQIVTGPLRLDHVVGRSESVLAVADVLCGAVVQSRVGNPTYLEALGGLVDIHHVS